MENLCILKLTKGDMKMKKTIFSILLAASLLMSATLYGCGNNSNSDDDLTDTKAPESTAADTSEDVAENYETAKDRLYGNLSKPAPDYEYQLWWADEVIIGEVIEQREGRWSNPDNELEEVENMWLTPYVIRVDKAYRDTVKEGDTVIVNTWNFFEPGKKPDDVQVTGMEDFYLEVGMSGMFMLSETTFLPTETPEYHIVFDEEGIFVPKDDGVAAIDINDSDMTLVSPSFEIKLSDIADDIVKADANHGGRRSNDDKGTI